MKKKMKILIAIILLIMIIGVVSFIAWNFKTTSIITLDINPSIEITLGRNEKVKKVRALNEDAKHIVSNNLKGKKLAESITIITDNLIGNDYIENNQVVILLYSTGNIENSKIEKLITNSFGEKQIHSDIIVIDKITEEDQKLAKKNDISLAKASYINSILKANENINIKYLIDKPVNELTETKRTGRYCDEGYSIEGDFCLKEIARKNADDGMVCPTGYYEYNDKCYEEVGIEETNKLICRDEFTLNGTICSRTLTINAEPSKYFCDKGEAKTRAEMQLTDSSAGDANDIVCVDYSNATHPVTPCELPASDPTERMSYGGKCYWHRAPVIAEGCPGKIQVAGECWDDASNIYICAGYRDGKQYKSKSEYCEHSIKYLNPTITEYKCPEKYTLNLDKCEIEETENAWHERICPSGYNLVDNDKCINDKIANKVKGLVCNEENTRLKGNQCVIYEIVEAKKNN